MAYVTRTAALIRIREMGVAQAHCQSECNAWIEAINTARNLAELEYVRSLNLTRRAHSSGGGVRGMREGSGGDGAGEGQAD